jgi:hypothetical protein
MPWYYAPMGLDVHSGYDLFLKDIGAEPRGQGSM